MLSYLIGTLLEVLQGYVVYSVKQKLKQEYLGLSGNEIKSLKSSGVEVRIYSYWTGRNIFLFNQIHKALVDFPPPNSPTDVLSLTLRHFSRKFLIQVMMHVFFIITTPFLFMLRGEDRK